MAIGEVALAVGDTVRLRDALPTSTIAKPELANAPWTADAPEVAALAGDLVVPLDAGVTSARATVGSRVFCVTLRVMASAVSVQGLVVATPVGPLWSGASARVTAQLALSDGRSIAMPRGVTWESADSSILSIDESGMLAPRRAGRTIVAGRVGLFRDSAVVQVTDSGVVTLQPAATTAFTQSVGVNVHLSYLDRVYGSGLRSIIIPRLQELGVRHLRDGGTVLPNEDWMREVYGRYREVAMATGARFTLIMSPRRTAAGPGSNYDDMTHVRELRDRLGLQAMAAVEGLNEHDNSGHLLFAAEVRAAQRALFEAVKGDPSLAASLEVLGPSMAFARNAPAVGDLSPYMDAGSIHPYSGGGVPTSRLAEHLAGARVISGNRPQQATEVGYHTSPVSTNPWHPAVSEGAQARYLLRELLQLFAAGIRRSFVYELIDEGSNPGEMEDHFGLLRLDGSAKPSFTALRNLLQIVGDAEAAAFVPTPVTLQLRGDTTGIRRLALQRPGGELLLLLWQDADAYDTANRRDLSVAARRLTLELPGSSRVRVYTPLTTAAPLTTLPSARTIQLDVPDHPVIVAIAP
ncbi:MAG: hypothetical protein IT359_01490 [Gemmatimonadaceae bacterium]|nr:hypothetical protein [Gemmatimonadaceae bacterium]